MSSKIKIAFSLDMVDVHHQVPNRNRYESKYYWDELYPMVVAAGFNAVEIPFDPFWVFRGGSGVPFTKYCVEIKFETVKNYVKHLKSQGIKKVAGIYINPTIFMRNDNLDFYFGATQYFAGEAIRYAKELSCDFVNFSPTPPYGLVHHYHGKNGDWDKWSAEFLKRTVQLINDLAKIANEKGITLALKNEYWSFLKGDNILPILKDIDSAVRLDIDAAHASIAGQNPSEILKNRANLIGSVHLTDTAFVDDAEVWKTPLPEYPYHRATQVFRDLGFGHVNLTEFYQSLQSIRYEGWAVVSCRQTREPMRALLRSRSCLNQIIRESKTVN